MIRRPLAAWLAILVVTALSGPPAASAQAPAPATTATKAVAVDPLPSWNDGAVKRTLLRFVREASDPASPGFVPAEERVATFDSDGTLIAEKPGYFPVMFLAERARTLAGSHPEWLEQPTLRAVIEDRPGAIGSVHSWELTGPAAATHTGMTEEEFEGLVRTYLDTARHPKFKSRLTDLVYVPMVELMASLRASGFKVYVCSAGGAGFVRAFSESAYGVPKDMVIGTQVQNEYQVRDGRGVLVRTPVGVEPLCDKAGKPIHIIRHVGRRPVLAFGNSDGDVEMLEFASDPPKPSLSLLLRHDDADREFAYDARSERALALAKERGWQVVSVKNDFKVVFRNP